MRKLFCLVFITGLFSQSNAQTLFTYGDKSVDARDFLRAFNKNNQASEENREKAMRDYLQLYINSRLKIEEAYQRKYDTLPQIRYEVNNLRIQISENYMTDPAAADRLVKEAFLRSQKDIRVSQIFISLRDSNGHLQQQAADKKRDEVLARLKAGEDFSKLAAELSDDPAAKTTKGDLGYVTVFTLPYEIENVVYNTPKGKYSEPLLSKVGYHIFRNMAERKAAGKIKAQQILLASPPNADDAMKKKTALLADSLYKRLRAGENFNRLASAFSHDYISAANGGIMPDISVGQYDPVFESVLWGLSKDGEMSKPFQTSHGWHILKRISMKPINSDSSNKAAMSELRNRILQDTRWKTSKDFIYTTVKEKAGFQKYPYSEEAMWAMTDSVLDLKPMKDIGRTIIASTPMFRIGDSIYTATTWVNYANTYRYKQDGTGAKPHPQVRDEFEQFALINYYRDHLEDFNMEFRDQMNEFRDGNLFFEIMQNEIWTKAQMDTTTLQALYETNKGKYVWTKSVDAILFFCSDEVAAKSAHAEVKKDPSSWRAVVQKNLERVVADSSRFEWEQVPNLFKMIPTAGLITDPFVNESDKSASFAYIIRVNNSPIQRTYPEAKGMVINDYQVLLEEQWNAKLREKYPVKINEAVLEQISKR